MTRASFHEDLYRDEEAASASDRSFGFVFTVVFAIIGFLPLLYGNDVRKWALALSLLFLLVAIFVPSALRPLNRVWMKFAEVLHRIVNPLVMGAMFFIVISPVALVMRLFGRDVLRRKFDPSAQTYWVSRDNAGTDPAGMRNQF